MKKLDFDVFSLITPTGKPAQPAPSPPPRTRSAAQMLAVAIRKNHFILPQVELVGKQMTRGASTVTHLQFGRHEVASVDLRRAMLSLPDADQWAMSAYLWSGNQFMHDAETGQQRELDPELPDDTERAFAQVYRLLDEACALRPLTKRVRHFSEVEYGGSAL